VFRIVSAAAIVMLAAPPALLGHRQRTGDELRGSLAARRPPMPDLALSRQEIEDIVAYLQNQAP
jgi:mono/diheme cytochrome c family protein